MRTLTHFEVSLFGATYFVPDISCPSDLIKVVSPVLHSPGSIRFMTSCSQFPTSAHARCCSNYCHALGCRNSGDIRLVNGGAHIQRNGGHTCTGMPKVVLIHKFKRCCSTYL